MGVLSTLFVVLCCCARRSRPVRSPTYGGSLHPAERAGRRGEPEHAVGGHRRGAGDLHAGGVRASSRPGSVGRSTQRTSMSTNFAVFGLGFVGYFLVGYAIMFSGLQLSGRASGSTSRSTRHGLDPLRDSGQWTFLWAKSGFALTGLWAGSRRPQRRTAAFFLYMVAFMDTTATIPTGAMAERWKWKAFVGWGLFCGAIYYPIFGGWTWGGGWLSQLGNSLAARVRLRRTSPARAWCTPMGGVAGLAGALVLGPRLGKFGADGKPRTLCGAQHPDGACWELFILSASDGSGSTQPRRSRRTDIRLRRCRGQHRARGGVRATSGDVRIA